MFAYGISYNYSNKKNLGYGKTHLLFPIGDFEYVYDPDIFDLFVHQHHFWKDESNRDITKFIDSIKYLDYDLDKIISIVVQDERSVEIIINCNEYFLVDTKYADELIKLIWD